MNVTLYDSNDSICCQMARLVLAEKGVAYTKHAVDISGARNEQFEPWYLELNPKGVVPTLQVGTAVITDTLRICAYIDANFSGPTLMPANNPQVPGWMKKIMALHYGVLMYKDLVDEHGECETLRQRHAHLVAIRERDGDPTGILERRIAGNARFRAVLTDPAQIEPFVSEARDLVHDMNAALSKRSFLAASTYTVADAFATAALARFEAHGYEDWWADESHVPAYYARLRARPSWAAAGVVTKLTFHG